MISEERVRELSVRNGQPAVSSVYLDVNGRRRPARANYLAAFESLVDGLRREVESEGGRELVSAVEADIDRMREWLERGFDRRGTSGLALFSCAQQGFFEVVEFPCTIRDEVGLGDHPHIEQLLKVLSEHESFLVVLIDHRSLRLLRVDLGETVELPGLIDLEARSLESPVSFGDLDHVEEEVAHAHFRYASMAVQDALQAWPQSRIIVGGPHEGVAGLERQLPPRS